jgi:PTH1 family peptidyl-tRNA hydrolase
MNQKTILIIGLGNHPAQFQYTKHNIGKDFLLFHYKNKLSEKKLFTFYEEENLSHSCLYIIPHTFMNNSGDICLDQHIINHIKKTESNEIIILHDDLELPFGKCKFRGNTDRGPRGHNGNRSIIKAIQKIQKGNYKQPYYFSLGIGRPHDGKVDSWVLKKFNTDEIKQLEETIFVKAKDELTNSINFVLKI